MTSNKRLIEMDFPDLILNKQDRSSVSGYHWVETKQLNDENRRHKLCALIKEGCGVRMYIPIGSPYEICREYNFPEKHLGRPIVEHGERECKAMVDLLPCNMFIPTLEFINTISAETWSEIYQDIIKECPDRIESLHRFNFFVLSDNEEYAGYYLKCYPFCNIKKDGDTVRKIKGNGRDDTKTLYILRKNKPEEPVNPVNTPLMTTFYESMRKLDFSLMRVDQETSTFADMQVTYRELEDYYEIVQKHDEPLDIKQYF